MPNVWRVQIRQPKPGFRRLLTDHTLPLQVSSRAQRDPSRNHVQRSMRVCHCFKHSNAVAQKEKLFCNWTIYNKALFNPRRYYPRMTPNQNTLRYCSKCATTCSSSANVCSSHASGASTRYLTNISDPLQSLLN